MRYNAVYLALYTKIGVFKHPPFCGLKLDTGVYKQYRTFESERDRRIYVCKKALATNNIGTIQFAGSKHTRQLIRKINDEYNRKGGEK